MTTLTLQSEAKALAKSRGATHVRVIGSDRLAKAQADIVKDLAVGDPEQTNVKGVDDETIFAEAGSIPVPYDPVRLLEEFENSNILRQCVDSYAQNIDGWGHHFEPVFDLHAEDIDEKIATAILVDADQQARARGGTLPASFEPTKQMIADTKKRITRDMKLELNRAKCFFDFSVTDRSFEQLRKDTRVDQEVIGHGFWEVRRDAVGNMAALGYVPSFTIRAISWQDDMIEREVPIRASPLRFTTRTEIHRARRYAQVLHGYTNMVRSKWLTYFKEFGDPRTISSASGKAYKDAAALQEAEKGVRPATELISFKVHTARSAVYGIPRWIGNLKSIMGSRKAEFVNLLYFDNKAVPPLALLVSGGSLTEEAVTRLESYIQNEIRGAENFHKILVIEAEPAGDPMDPLNSGKMRIELVPLTKAIHNDALFGKYDTANRNKVGESMRIPRILRADTADFNRATADAAIRFAEEQVFAPERTEFDWMMNRFIMPVLGIKYWTFVSNSPISTDLDRAKAIGDLVKQGVLIPAEARRLTARVFNEDLDTITAAWVKQPLQLTLAQQMTSSSPDDGGKDDKGRQGGGIPQRAVEVATNGDTKKLADMVRGARARGEDVVETVAGLLQQQDRMLEKARGDARTQFETLKAEADEHSDGPETIVLKWDGPISKYFTPTPEGEGEGDGDGTGDAD